MKSYPSTLFVLPLALSQALFGTLHAQTYQETAPVSPPSATAANDLLTAAQIDELLAPIALYPDPLVALILPASTFPADLVLAARFLQAGGDVSTLETQPWDDSVKALARYPEVVKWMDENLAWTQQVGAAFVLQPAAVLTSTQRLRAAAIAAGTLQTTPEQTVVVEREVIRIEPAQREIIYVPVYDPLVVYRPAEVYYPSRLVTFSVGYPTGLWLSYYCNWGVNTVVVVNRPYRAAVWNGYPAWSYPRHHGVYHHHNWRPTLARVQTVRRDYERRPERRTERPSENRYVQRAPDRSSNGPRDYQRPSDNTRRDPRPDTVSTSPARRPSAADAAATALDSQRPRQTDNRADAAASANAERERNRRATAAAHAASAGVAVPVTSPTVTRDRERTAERDTSRERELAQYRERFPSASAERRTERASENRRPQSSTPTIVTVPAPATVVVAPAAPAPSRAHAAAAGTAPASISAYSRLPQGRTQTAPAQPQERPARTRVEPSSPLPAGRQWTRPTPPPATSTLTTTTSGTVVQASDGARASRPQGERRERGTRGN